jgi:hypothetical protein
MISMYIFSTYNCINVKLDFICTANNFLTFFLQVMTFFNVFQCSKISTFSGFDVVEFDVESFDIQSVRPSVFRCSVYFSAFDVQSIDVQSFDFQS